MAGESIVDWGLDPTGAALNKTGVSSVPYKYRPWDLIPKAADRAFGSGDKLATPEPDANGYLYGGTSVAEEQALRQRYQNEQAGADNRQLDFTMADQGRAAAVDSRRQQSALSQAYQQQINGQGPSVAQSQLRSSQQTNAQMMAAMAAGTRGGGGNVLAAQRMAQRNAMMAGQVTNRDAATLRAQETAAAMSGQSALLNGMRQGDVAQTGLDQQRTLQQTQLNDQRNQFYADKEAHAYDQKMAGSVAFQQNKIGMQSSTDQFNAKLDEDARKRQGDGIKSGAGALSMFAVGGL